MSDPCNDPVVEDNVDEIRQRSRIGEATYHSTLAMSPLSLSQFCQHGREESLDLANYLRTIQRRLEIADPAELAAAASHALTCIHAGDLSGAAAAIEQIRNGLAILNGQRAVVEVV